MPDDVPDEVAAALGRAAALIQAPAPDDPAALPKWWRDRGTGHDVRAAAFERLYAWQSTAGRHRAELQATADAAEASRARAWEARRSAMEVDRTRGAR